MRSTGITGISGNSIKIQKKIQKKDKENETDIKKKKLE